LNQAVGIGFDEIRQLIDVCALICQGFYTANIAIYIHYRGLRSAILGVVMQNDIDKVTRIVVIFPVLGKNKSEGTATYNVFYTD
jgi:hypothetical protein